MNKVALITGASAGMGKETAKLLAQKGYKVYGAARRLEKMEELKKHGIIPIALDVTKNESEIACTNQIFEESGRIDILINNAGFGSYGAIEDVSMADAHYQLEVNLYGAARLIQLVLPKMRANGFGKIVNVSSVGGRIAGPMGGWYHASKFALEGLSDSLRNEVKQFGIDVVVIRPGATKTEWGDIAFESLLKTSGNTAYKELAHKIHRSFTAMGKNAVDVGKVANVIAKSIEARHPKTRYACDSAGKLVLFLRKILSDKQLDKLYMHQIT